MNEKIVKLENLFEEITNIQKEIKTKTELRNEYIMSHVNPIFEEIQDKIDRIRLENTLKSLTPEKISARRKRGSKCFAVVRGVR